MTKLIIFDVDGVLEKEELINKARHEAQLKHLARKLKISLEEAKKRYAAAKEDLPAHRKHTSAYVFMHFGFKREDYFKILNSIDPAGLIETHDNCKEMLEKLGRNNILVTYSNTSKKATIRTLEVLGIKKYFKKNYSSDEFQESKPSMKNLEKIMRDLGFTSQNSVMVGNSLEKDIMPAYALKMKAVLFDPYKAKKKHKEAIVIHDLLELVKHV